MRNERITVLVEIALAVALAAVLGRFKIALPLNIFGGSISLAMLPILIVSLRRGLAAGLIAGALYGVVDPLLDGFKGIHWASFFLDYALAYAAVGLAGLGSKVYRAHAAENPVSATAWTIPWMVLGGVGRFFCHVVSGAVLFAEYAPEGQNPWIYSLVYNISYVGPSLVICIVFALILLPLLQKAVPVTSLRTAKA